jgi:HEAT repeat protein
VEPLLRHLGDADEDFARQVIQALGSTGDRRTAEPLIAIANNRKASEAVREAAIISLGELADPRALETVLTIYKDAAASESTRRFCLRPIARCGRDDKARALAAIRNALVSKDELTRLNAIAALSHFHDAPSIALLESLLGDRTEPMIVHRVAAAALVSSGDPGAIERVYRESLLREAQAIELRLEVLDSLAQSHVATGYRWLVDAADVEGWR